MSSSMTRKKMHLLTLSGLGFLINNDPNQRVAMNLKNLNKHYCTYTDNNCSTHSQPGLIIIMAIKTKDE